ncbi:MAG TPA: chemotaxis protein CheW [Crinalium sp.]|jgi:chemotaxis signal transduction protein
MTESQTVSQTVAKSQLLARAKQGDPHAITQLMNSSLQAKGIQTTVFRQNDCLEILLEAKAIPNPTVMMAFMQRGFGSLNPEAIARINIYARRIGETDVAWRQTLPLRTVEDHDSLGTWVNRNLPSASSLTKSLNAEGTAETGLSAQPLGVARSAQEARFLRVQLGSEDAALLPLLDIKEVLKLSPDEILPVPDMPACVLGIYNSRGEMLWLIDLLAQLGLQSRLSGTPALVPTEAHMSRNGAGAASLTAIAIQADDKSIAIAIPNLFDIELFDLHELHPPAAHLFPSYLLPFIRGYFPDAGLPVLDVNALLRDPQFQIHAID